MDDVRGVLPGRIQSQLAAPAQIVERDGRKRPEQCGSCEQGIDERQHLVAERQPEQDDAEDGVDHAEKQCVARHRLEVFDALPERIIEVGDADRTDCRLTWSPYRRGRPPQVDAGSGNFRMGDCLEVRHGHTSGSRPSARSANEGPSANSLAWRRTLRDWRGATSI